MNLLHQVLPRGVCKGLLWLPMTYICIAFLNHAIEVGSCKSQPQRTANAFCHFKGLWRVSLIAKDGWSLALLYAPNFLPFSLVPTPPAIPLSQPWHFCVRLHARSVFYRVHILRCLGPAQAQPVYKSSRWSHGVVWIGSVWSALLPAPEGTRSVFPHYQHRAGWIWNRLAVKMKVLRALVHRRSLRNLPRERPFGAGCRVYWKGAISATWESFRCTNNYARGAAEPVSVLVTPLCLVLELIHISYGGNWTLLVITPSYCLLFFPSKDRNSPLTEKLNALWSVLMKSKFCLRVINFTLSLSHHPYTPPQKTPN